MDSIIIIGFSYSKIDKYTDRPYLHGILIDMYRAYNYSYKLLNSTDKGINDQRSNNKDSNTQGTDTQRSNTKSIKIITDLHIDLTFNEIKDSIIDSIVDAEVINFISQMRKNGFLIDYTSKQQLLEELSNAVLGKKRIFFYYTGHANNGNILLPLMNDLISYRCTTQDAIINLSNIRDILSSGSRNSAEIFVILDCCNSNGLDLPYKLVDKVYRLTSKSNKEYPYQKIICFSSTNIDENSIASKKGSIFSHYLFELLGKSRNIGSLLSEINKECAGQYNQTATVYSSYPDLKILWRWMCSTDSDVVNIKLNCVENYFILKKMSQL